VQDSGRPVGERLTITPPQLRHGATPSIPSSSRLFGLCFDQPDAIAVKGNTVFMSFASRR